MTTTPTGFNAGEIAFTEEPHGIYLSIGGEVIAGAPNESRRGRALLHLKQQLLRSLKLPETAPAGDAAKLADRIERAVMVNGQIGPNLNRNERDLIVALLRAAPQWRTEQVEALARAMWQLLDDMGSGHAVCDQAKQEAISALEPFRASVQGGEC